MNFHDQATAHNTKRCKATELWSCRNVFSGVMNHALQPGSLMNESGFAKTQENVTYIYGKWQQ